MANDKSQLKRFQIPHDERFTTVPNSLIVDQNLSDADKILLIYLFSNSESWIIRHHHTCKTLGWGRDKGTKTIKNLIKYGYIKRELVRDNGRFSHYNYIYHYKPIFKNEVDEQVDLSSESIKEFHENHEEKCPHTECEPSTENPSTVKTSTENQALPKTKEPTPKTQGYGKAMPPLPPAEESYEQPDLGTGKDLPFYIAKDSGIGEQAQSDGRKYKRPQAEQDSFEFLMSKELSDSNGVVNPATLSYLAHKYPIERLHDAYYHLDYKVEHDGFQPRSRIAFFRHLLEQEHCPITINNQINREYAEQMIADYEWYTLLIKDKYVVDEKFSGKDISLNIHPEAFISAIWGLYKSITGS